MLPYVKIFNFILYPYALLMGIAWGVSYLLLEKQSSNKKTKIDFIVFFLLSWIGAKLFFLLTAPKAMVDLMLPRQSFWLGGGFVFYGGLLACIVYVCLMILLKKRELKYYQVYIPPLLVGHGIGRIGCWLAGCCFGITYNELQIPVQLIESFFCIILGLYSLKNRISVEKYLIIYAAFRFLIEFLRADLIRGHIGYFSTSQILSIIILLTIIFKLALSRQKI